MIKATLEKAIADFDNAIALNNKLAMPIINRGLANIRQRKLKSAIDDFTVIIE